MNRTRTDGPAPALRAAAVGVPLSLLTYGILRLIDRVGGTDQSGWLWVTGHLFLLAAFLGLAALLLLARHRLGSTALGWPAAGLGLAGAAAAVWVTLGDIVPSLDRAWSTPDVVTDLGPPALVLGVLTLLALAVRRGLFTWPHLFLVALGFGGIVVSLDLLPLSAVLLGVGLRPFWSWSGVRHGGRVDDAGRDRISLR